MGKGGVWFFKNRHLETKICGSSLLRITTLLTFFNFDTFYLDIWENNGMNLASMEQF
jgi:hypothetical protein